MKTRIAQKEANRMWEDRKTKKTKRMKKELIILHQAAVVHRAKGAFGLASCASSDFMRKKHNVVTLGVL